MPTCNKNNGFYPGRTSSTPSTFLKELNEDTIKEGSHVFALYSTKDDLIKDGDIVNGVFTSKWPTLDGFKQYSGRQDTHINMRDNTADVQYELVTKGALNASSMTPFDGNLEGEEEIEEKFL